MGSGVNPTSTQGPLINRAAVERVSEHVQDALSKGAQLATGGARPATTLIQDTSTHPQSSQGSRRTCRLPTMRHLGHWPRSSSSRNTGKISASETPVGGIKESSYGREGSKYAMVEHEVFKSVTSGNLNH
ncbi:hypothetical protein V8C34DRAFT_284192 [Trichoderma compactum]